MSFCFNEVKMQIKLLIGLYFSLLLFACGTSHNEVDTSEALKDDSLQSNNSEQQKSKISKIMQLNGTIVFQNMEGGFYGFIADNGDKFLPIGLPLEYKKNGLIVEIEAEKIEDMMTTKQFGQNIQIKSVVVTDDSAVNLLQKNTNQ